MTESTITVLHVEDDEGLTELVREYIRAHHDDIDVHTEWNGDDALAHLETTTDVDCVLSDYQMPGLNGLELLEATRERWPGLPFILFTGRGNEWLAEQAITAGVTDYIQKRASTNQLGMVVTRIRDAVDRHRTEGDAEQPSQFSTVEFELMVKTTEDYAVFSLDEDGYIQTWNAGGEALKGYASEEIVGEHVSVFYRDEDVEAGVPERHLREAAAEGRVRDEGWRVRKGKSEFLADVTITALREDEGDELTGYTESTHDRTRELEEQSLRDQNEQLKHLLAAISHDLRSPLAVAGGSIELVRATGDVSRLDKAEHALDRTTDLLDYLEALAEEGRPIMELESVELHDIADQAWSHVVTDGDNLAVEESGTLMADRRRLQQLFENLFRNSVEHVGPDVSVGVGLLEGGEFYVEDDGPGIPDAERADVFELGYSGDADGSGLGLAICKQIVEAHGWTIEVTDSSDGGARVEVSDVEMA